MAESLERRNQQSKNELPSEKRRRALTSTERSKLWYQRNKQRLAEENLLCSQIQSNVSQNDDFVIQNNFNTSADTVMRRRRPLTSTERSKLWYQRKKKKLAEKNSLCSQIQSNVSQNIEFIVQNNFNTSADTLMTPRRALTSTERSKLWYQRKKKKLAEKNSLCSQIQPNVSQNIEFVVQNNFNTSADTVMASDPLELNNATTTSPNVIKEEIDIKTEPLDCDEDNCMEENLMHLDYLKRNIACKSNDCMPKLTPIRMNSPPPLTKPHVIPTLRWFGNTKDEAPLITNLNDKEEASTSMDSHNNDLSLEKIAVVKSISNEERNRNKQQYIINDEDIEGYEFFKYHFSYVKMLDPAQKLRVGIKVQQAFLEELQNNKK